LLVADDRGGQDGHGMHLVAKLAQRGQARIAMAHVHGPVSDAPAPHASGGSEDLFLGLEVTHVETSGVDVASAISGLAERLQADLVVVEHRHLGLLQGLFHTSTAARLALHTRIPLLVLEA
jgi:nucleotide-binding universal stress UspA family protein